MLAVLPGTERHNGEHKSMTTNVRGPEIQVLTEDAGRDDSGKWVRWLEVVDCPTQLSLETANRPGRAIS
jgi:hypothetical protein